MSATVRDGWYYVLKPWLKNVLLSGLAQCRSSHTSPSEGVNVVGFLSAESGLGQSVRSLVHALDAAGIPTALYDVPFCPSRRSDMTFAPRYGKRFPFDTTIIVLQPESLPRFLLSGGWASVRSRRVIGYWTWELPQRPRDWNGALRFVDEVWVPSTFVASALASCSKPVHVVPHAIPALAHARRDRHAFGLPEDSFLFLSITDALSVLERKNPRAAIDAFLRAFPSRKDVGLVLKIANLPPVHALRSEIEELRKKRVFLVDASLSAAQMQELLATCDAVISLHRAEGFGIALAEAMLHGKPVIATKYSGNLQFMHDGNALLIPHHIVPLGRRFGPYAKGSMWADPRLDAAVAALRALVEDERLQAKIGHQAARDIRAVLSPQNIGEVIATRLGIA